MNSGAPKESNLSSVWVAVEKSELPKKKYFKIGEVALLVGVEPHVLRYWQTQFPRVRPQKSRSGHRLYRRKDVEILLAIRELLHVQRFTIAGARQALRTLLATGDLASQPPRAATSAVDSQALINAKPATAGTPNYQNNLGTAFLEPTAEVEIVGLAAEDLKNVMEAELARRAPDGVVSVDLVPGTEPVDSTVPENHVEVEIGIDTEAVPPSANDLDPSAESVLRLSDLPQNAETDIVTDTLQAEPKPNLARQPSIPSSASVSASVSASAAEHDAPSSDHLDSVQGLSEYKRTPHQQNIGKRRQLGFGFIPTNKELLLKARREVLSLLEYLDQEDTLARRRCD